MSAIAGVVQLDGAEASAQAAAFALEALSARTRGHPRVWTHRKVALASDVLMAGSCPGRTTTVIACDASLYNRSELCAGLGLVTGEPDAVIILAAYDRWGDACVNHLDGDFAFALWDGVGEVLFCARDHAGVRPFFYTAGADRFVFASELKGILALKDEDDIDPERIADFLLGLAADRTSSWHADIVRLPPGHWLKLRHGRIEVQCYWTPSAPAAFRKTDAVEAVEASFVDAVRRRLAGSTGVMLSGGLDSSAIAVTASRSSASALPTFSMLFHDAPDERAQIQTVLGAGSFAPCFLEVDRTGPFTGFGQVLHEQDGVFLAPGLGGCRQLYSAAAGAHIGALLDGHGGDEVVSHGFGRLKQLALAGQWREVWVNSAAEADIYGISRPHVFLEYWRHLGPARGLFRTVHDLTSRIDARVRRGLGRSEPAGWRGFLDRSFAEATGAGERWLGDMRARSSFSSEAGQHVFMLTSPLQAHALEVLDHASAHAGVEARYPFWDRRLIELCLSLRPEDKLSNGWPRFAFRQAMRGHLPEAIRLRRDKFDFTQSLVRSLVKHHSAELDDILLSGSSLLRDYADMAALGGAWRRMKDDPRTSSGSGVQAIWRYSAMAMWLEVRRARADKRRQRIPRGIRPREAIGV